MDKIKTVTVLGASGTVGSLTGGLMAQNGLKVYFLSRNQAGAQRGLARAIEQARAEVIGHNIVCGDYANTLESALAESDWILECVSEDLAIKEEMYAQVDRYLRLGTVVSSTTSSLPLSALPRGRSAHFRKNFLSTHFYNPPGKMLACEITTLPDTDPQVGAFMYAFLNEKLRRVVIPVKNTAAFAGNRIAFLLFNRITALAEEYGVEMMDYLIGPYTGRLLPPLSTIDLVGLDIHRAIIESLQNHTQDEMHDLLKLPAYIPRMIDHGLLGLKAGARGGFYRKDERGVRSVLDPVTLEYVPLIKPHVAFVEKAKELIHVGRYRDAFEVIRTAHGREAELVIDLLCTYVVYSYARIGEVTKFADGIDGIDRVMSFGFNWAGPSLIVILLGGHETVIRLCESRGLAVPEALRKPQKKPVFMNNAGRFFPAR